MADYVHIAPGATLPDLSRHAPFRAVVVLEFPLTPEERGRIAAWLVKSGCLYMMAWGIGCSEFHDDVDMASLAEFDFRRVPDDRHIMTTWHDNLPLEEPFWFAHYCALHSHVELRATLLLHVAAKSDEQAMLNRFEAAKDWSDDEEASISAS